MNHFITVSATAKHSLLGIVLCAGLLGAAPQTFEFKDPKGAQSIGIFLDSKLEPLRGTADGISGSVTFDAGTAQIVSGVIEVAASSIRMTNPLMTTVLHGGGWLNVDSFPVVRAVFSRQESIKKKSDTRYEIVVAGTFTLKGVTREMSMPVFVEHLKGMANARNKKGEGDLLMVRTRFVINRDDFGLKPEMTGDVVAKEIQIDIAISGFWNVPK